MSGQYRLIDADNHYYEPHDAFTRHLEREFASRALHIRERPDGLGQVYFGDEPVAFMRVTQSDYMGAPGALRAFMDGYDPSQGFVMKDIINPHDFPEFMHKEPRLKLMDQQGLEAAIVLPTLAVSVEHEMTHDIPAMYANLRSFNRWLEEDWGYGSDGRIFAVPMLSLYDPDQAIAELERVLEAGAKAIHLNAGPCGGRSHAHPDFDPFWSRVQEAGVLVTYHIGYSAYNELWSVHWGEPARVAMQAQSALQWYFGHGDRPIMDNLAALILNNLFGRFPGLRVAVLEYGGAWVEYLLYAMDHSAKFARNGRWPGGQLENLPSEIFKEHVYVAPYPEEDPARLIELLGPTHVLFGSDYPHAEGLADPAEYATKLMHLPERDARLIMGENTAALLGLS